MNRGKTTCLLFSFLNRLKYFFLFDNWKNYKSKNHFKFSFSLFFSFFFRLFSFLFFFRRKFFQKDGITNEKWERKERKNSFRRRKKRENTRANLSMSYCPVPWLVRFFSVRQRPQVSGLERRQTEFGGMEKKSYINRSKRGEKTFRGFARASFKLFRRKKSSLDDFRIIPT